MKDRQHCLKAILALFMVLDFPALAQSADETAALAREAAKADRHGEAIDAFRSAMAAAPDRRREWLLELADQLTWSKQLGESIPLYQEAARTKDRDEERRARRGLARALSWNGNYAAAIAEYDRVLAMGPDDEEVRLARAEVVSWANQEVDKTIEHARNAAKANRHAEAIATYRRAIKAAPARRNEWLLELADQLTWSNQLDDAIPLYREAAEAGDPASRRRARCGLARAMAWKGDHAAALAEYERVLAESPEDREARLGRAKVLSWTNRQKPALTEYEAVLRDHPDDTEALRGIGRVQSWRGRHRESAERMSRYLEEYPHDREATGILFESYQWMGRPDRAKKILLEQTAADPDDKSAASALEKLEFQLRPTLRFDWRESHQSDDVRTSVFSLESTLHLADGASGLGFRYDLANFVPPQGPVDEIVVQRAGLRARHHFSDLVEWNGGLYLDIIDTRGASGDHDILTYDTYVTLRPNDLLRFDIGSSRWIFDSEDALRDGLNAIQGNVSMDVMPDELTKFSGRFSLADYSDGNNRTWWQFEMERRIWREPNIYLGYRYTGFDFSERWQRGYYSPDLYHSNEILARASGWFADKFRWQLRSTIGYEHELPGENRLIWSAGGGIAWEITRQLEIEIAYDFSSSSAASANGFDRGTGRLGLRYTF